MVGGVIGEALEGGPKNVEEVLEGKPMAVAGGCGVGKTCVAVGCWWNAEPKQL